MSSKSTIIVYLGTGLVAALVAMLVYLNFEGEESTSKSVIAEPSGATSQFIASERDEVVGKGKEPLVALDSAGIIPSPEEIEVSRDLGPLLGVLGRDASLSVPQRIQALEILSLTVSERAMLYEFLASRENDTGLSDEVNYWLKNDIMTYLRNTEEGEAVYFDEISSLFIDRQQDVVMRDYALQHLSVWAEQGNDRGAVEVLLLEGVKEREGSIAGTAILALARLDELNLLVRSEAKKIGDRAESIAGNEDFSTAARASALQVLVAYDPETSEILSKRVLLRNDSPPLLTISAIGALRGSNKPEHQTLLKNLKNSGDIRIKRAAHFALLD